MKGKYIIVDMISWEYMKNTTDGSLVFYDTLQEAKDICAIHELINAWVIKLEYNHINKD